MRLAAAVTVLSCLLLVGCGGSSDGSETTADPGDGQTLEELWRAPGDDVAVVPGTVSHEAGDVRVSFLVLDSENRLVTLPTARVWVASALDAPPFLESSAKLERVGLPGEDEADVTHIYVASLKLPRPGKYWLLAEPEGGPRQVQALGNVVVATQDSAPDVGDRAFASETPTIASVGGDLSKVTTRRPPDEELVTHSVAETLKAKIPFVVTFSTPEFCTSRTCGPVVDVVDEVRRRSEDSVVRFIHVEVYEGNDPANGFNRWMNEWNLETEPWTFVVDANGRIVERFEGSVSVNELETAVQEKLVG